MRKAREVSAEEWKRDHAWEMQTREIQKQLEETEIQRDRLVRLIRDVLATELDLSIEWHLIDIDTGQPLAEIERTLDSGLRRLRRAVAEVGQENNPNK